MYIYIKRVKQTQTTFLFDDSSERTTKKVEKGGIRVFLGIVV
jgi:hypothetical protein